MGARHRRVVIAATGTEVGKTFVTVRLARELRARIGPKCVLAVKPIESGGRSDADALDEDAQIRARPHPLHQFDQPISPHLAARRAGVEITMSGVLDWLLENESRLAIPDTMLSYSVTLIETAGGVLSPLAERARNVELLEALAPSRVIVVAPDALGVLHALDATLTALRFIAPAAARACRVVLNTPATPDRSTGTNAEEIERLGIASPVFRLERNATSVAELTDWVLS